MYTSLRKPSNQMGQRIGAWVIGAGSSDTVGLPFPTNYAAMYQQLSAHSEKIYTGTV